MTEHTWVPVDACTLPTVEQPVRVAELDDLFADGLAGVERLSDVRARLSLIGSSGLRERIQDLLDRESQCCSFFTFEVSASGGTGSEPVVVDVSVPATRADVLAALVGRAEAVRRSCDRPDPGSCA